MRIIGIIFITACAVINATIVAAVGYAIWTDRRTNKARQAAADLAAANEADSFDQWAREMGHV